MQIYNKFKQCQEIAIIESIFYAPMLLGIDVANQLVDANEQVQVSRTTNEPTDVNEQT
jgi:hypothetical protein